MTVAADEEWLTDRGSRSLDARRRSAEQHRARRPVRERTPGLGVRRVVGAVVLTLALAGCGPNPFVRPAPDRVIPINVGGRVMDVPGGNLESAVPATVSSNPQDQGVALLVGRAPDFAGRSAATAEAFKASGSDALIWVMISGHEGRSPEDRVQRLLGLELRQQQGEATAFQGGRHYVTRRGSMSGVAMLEDVYVRADGSFTACSRRAGPIKSPSCETWFALGSTVVKMRFGRRWLDTREALRATVESKLALWSRPVEEA